MNNYLLAGNPNVGKSTLMNSFVGERLSIITSKAQTTRHRILGIVNGEDFQMILSDTPGIIKPAYQLQESMMDFVKSAFEDADVLIYIVELGEKELKDEAFFNKITNANIPVLLLINKIDKGNEAFGKWETIKRFELTPEIWGIDNGLLTPTMKPKRTEILAKYQNLYNKIFNENNLG